MLKIRSATANDCEILTNIAINSESYWGYDLDYMTMFKSIYKVTEKFVNNNPTFLMEENRNIIGFYGILIGNTEISLEYFFIDPQYIRQGYGKMLWNHLITTCKKLGIKEFSLVTSPQAKDFYVKLGAICCGEVESLLKKGRIIPQLIYIVEE